MPVISFASAKGGAGKTTSAIVLGTTLAQRYTVVIIDADPAKRLMSWADKGPLPLRLEVMASGGERHIMDEIEAAQRRADFVLVDLEGAATRTNAYAMSQSDLVIIPMGDETSDAEGAIETLHFLDMEARASRRNIPMRILFCRTEPFIKTRQMSSVNQQIRDRYGAFSTELAKRAAYSALHGYGGDLYTMDIDNVTGVSKAIYNAELLCEEVLKALATFQGILRENTQPNTRSIIENFEPVRSMIHGR